MKWDAQLDAHGYEKATITNQRLLPTRWRKDREDGWRMDVKIDVRSETDDESNKEVKEDEVEDDKWEDGSDTEKSDKELSDD